MTKPPDTTADSLSPEVLPIPAEVDLAARASFTAPLDVEFPALTASDDAPVSAFGNLVQSDVDPDLLDVNVSHVREVRYSPGQAPCETVPPEAITPDALPSQPAPAASVPAAPAHARLRRIVLVLLAVGIPVILGVVAVLIVRG
jgi:hypothetical protein